MANGPNDPVTAALINALRLSQRQADGIRPMLDLLLENAGHFKLQAQATERIAAALERIASRVER